MNHVDTPCGYGGGLEARVAQLEHNLASERRLVQIARGELRRLHDLVNDLEDLCEVESVTVSDFRSRLKAARDFVAARSAMDEEERRRTSRWVNVGDSPPGADGHTEGNP